MMKEIELHPRVSELPPQVVKGALNKAQYSIRTPSRIAYSSIVHLCNWLSEFVDTGAYDLRHHACPDEHNRAGVVCRVCNVMGIYINVFKLASCDNPLAQLETFIQTINNKAHVMLRHAEDGSDEAKVAGVVYPYLSNAAKQINQLVLDAEFSEMVENEYLDEEFETSPLDKLLTTSKEGAINYREAEWEGVTPVKHPRTSEIIEMDVDSLLDMYTHYKQLNSFYGDGSFNRQLGVIEATLKEHVKAREKSSG